MQTLYGGLWYRNQIARYHNIYRPFGTYDVAEKSSRCSVGIIKAKKNNEDKIEVGGWRTNKVLYIDDCVEGTSGYLSLIILNL